MSLYGFFFPLSFAIAAATCAWVVLGIDPIQLWHTLQALHAAGQR